MWPAWRERSRLQDTPAEERTPEACLEAIREDGWAFDFVLLALRTPELCLKAVKTGGGALRFAPWGVRIRNPCLEAVKGDGWAFRLVPEDLKTPGMCMAAVKSEGPLRYVPEELLSPELAWKSSGGTPSP